MSYLIPKDYNKSIQADNLTQIIGGDVSIQAAAELTAIDEAKSYLVQKYDTAAEITNTTKHDKTLSTYKVNDRVYLDYPAYVQATSYNIGDLVTYNGNEYTCTASTTGVFDATKWTLIAPQYSLFFSKAPQTPFSYKTFYKIGDQVYWNGKTYTALVGSVSPSHSLQLQYEQYQNLPPNNIFPDDSTFGPTYWGNGVAYSIPGNTAITNTTYWTAGDNRSQQLLTFLVAITLYYVHMRISPRNIPELRVKAYDDAIAWFKKCAKGEVTANLPVLQPKKGARIRYGGNIKNNNSY